jgi:hypothetical protein
MSTIKATTLSTQSNATVPIDTVVNGTAKAWVNFNGTGTVAIRASFNVASITDNGVGDYTLNFAVAMVDVNYANTFGSNTDIASGNFVATMGVSSSSGSVLTKTVSALRVTMKNQSWVATDATESNITIFR